MSPAKQQGTDLWHSKKFLIAAESLKLRENVELSFNKEKKSNDFKKKLNLIIFNPVIFRLYSLF